MPEAWTIIVLMRLDFLSVFLRLGLVVDDARLAEACRRIRQHAVGLG